MGKQKHFKKLFLNTILIGMFMHNLGIYSSLLSTELFLKAFGEFLKSLGSDLIVFAFIYMGYSMLELMITGFYTEV